MARRFVRVDLSETARDYRPIAVEPGVPMLDRSGANARIIYRWLGGMVCEPVWEGDSVGFYVRDDEGGRLEDIVCQPASAQDMKTLLKDDLQRLRERLEQSKAETPTERLLRRILIRTFEELVDNPYRTDLDSYFYRYRDANGNWRLIWCWGYQRVDNEPAPAVVCTDPDCNMLFVRRPGKSPRCPSCEGLLSNRPIRRTNWKVTALAALLLLLLLGGSLWWGIRPSHLLASPNPVTAPVGTRIEFQVWKAGLLRKQDVTRQTIGISYDPRVARFNQVAGTVTLVGVGSTVVCLYAGGMKTEVALQAEPSANPDKITIEPQKVELGVGTTARLKLFGEYKDGRRVDLSEAAEWKPQNDGTVFSAGSLVEGLAQGATNVVVRYRANAASPYMDAGVPVSVTKTDYQAIEVGVDPKQVGVGLAGRLRMDAVATDGHRYSILESSQLKTGITPPYLAEVRGSNLKGQRAGAGKLDVAFGPNNLAGNADFTVVVPRSVGPEVKPEKLDLVVGEITDISYISPDVGPVRLASSNAGIVDITAANRIVGVAAGDAEVDVTQGGASIGKIAVTVTQAEFESIAVEPGSVAVLVDGTERPRVMAALKGSDPPRSVEIAPSLVVCDKTPSPKYADFDPRLLEVRGVGPTPAGMPQTLLVHVASHKASAPVEVVAAPCKLEITPAGPIDLPLGQMMRLQGYATYSGGRCVQVPAERLKWSTEQKSVPGLKLYVDRVGALKPGAGPLTIFATYFKQESNHVAFKSVEADPNLHLALEVDRTLRLTGEPGQALLTASSPTGDVELVPELASFKSSDPKIVRVIEKTGSFGTGTTGEATVTATHLAAKDPATLKLHVYDAAKARLTFEPATVRLAVNEQVPLKLFLEVEDAGKKDRAAMEGPGVSYTVGQQQAVRFAPPQLTGLAAAKQFEISGSYLPAVSRPAYAKVEVVAAEAGEIRITPATAALAPGQTVALAVERKVAGSDEWQEVRPAAAAWTVPSGLIWAAPSENLRPTATVPPDVAKGDLTVKATVDGQEATATISVKPAGPDAKDPAARLTVDREPGGWYLPVGQQQRYAVLVDKGGSPEPAADVRWPADFENQYVKWEAPVLTAKQENYTQWMRAEAGGRVVLFHTTTYKPQSVDTSTPPPTGDVPQFVKILSDQGPTVRFPMGALFDDFRVEAHYADGFTRLVTKRCTMRTPESPDQAIVTAANGRLSGIRVGATDVSAEYDGVHSQAPPLHAEVMAGIDIDKLVVDPNPVTMQPGERFGLKAIGFKNGKSIGEITGLGGMTWQTSNPQVAGIDGPTVVGTGLGTASVTVKHGAVTSQPGQVNVVASIGGRLKVEPHTIVLHVGESVRVGADIAVLRDDMDVGQQCQVIPEMPGIVQFIPETRSLVGKNVGHVPVGFAMGDKVARVEVDVQPGGLIDGEILIEPNSTTLAPGQCESLRAYVVTKDGDRIDRTSSAMFRCLDAAGGNGVSSAVRVDNGKLCALAPGKAKIVAVVGGATSRGQAFAEVLGQAIQEVVLDPKQIDMSVGDTAQVNIFGRADCGTKELFPQPDLKVSTGRQGVIQMIGNDQVRGQSIGQDSINVAFGSRPAAQIRVNVANNPFTDLQIDPTQKTVAPGYTVAYQVTAMRGGQRQILLPENGVQVAVTDPNVAQVISGTSVTAKAPGQTTVVAQLGTQRAEAALTVVQGGAGVDVVSGGGVDVFSPGQTIYTGNGNNVDVVHVGSGGGVEVVSGPGVAMMGEGTTVAVGDVVGLQFEPDKLVIGTNAQPMGVRVYETLKNGGRGRDVSANPGLIYTDPAATVAMVQKGGDCPLVKGVAAGQTSMSATLNNLTAKMFIEVNGDASAASGAALIAVPNPVTLGSGQVMALDAVQVDPGGGQSPFPVAYKVTPAEGQGIVTVDADNKLHGVSVGSTQVTVAATDEKFPGLSTVVQVQVINGEALSIQPNEISVQVGDTTDPIAVMSKAADGSTIAVPATVESLDPTVVAPSATDPSRFEAKGMGQTKLRAVYRGQEVFATVSVVGQRFTTVNPSLDPKAQDFSVNVEVLAAGTEGELEYRVYKAGDTPEENWVPNQPDGDHRKVLLRSKPIPYAADSEMYHLVLEARNKGGKSVQPYPLTFQLVRTLQIQQLKDPTQPKDTK